VGRLIDLSQEIYQGMYVYPGHLKTVIWDFHSHEETRERFEGGMSYQSKGLLMSDHGPTHVDALNHLDPREGAPSIDEMDLSLFYGDATCIDVSHKEPQTYIDDTDLDEAGSNWIVEKGIKIFGVDSPSPDNPISRTYPCHMMCREHGITHYENLANLDQLVGKHFTLIGFPLRLRGGTGSPVRTVAVLDE
jgi:kynurenine formamidase